MWVKLFLGHSLIIIQCNWGEFCPKIRITKKVTYSNSLLKLWIERKSAVELIPVKSYKKCLVFLIAKTYHKSLSKGNKGVFTIV